MKFLLLLSDIKRFNGFFRLQIKRICRRAGFGGILKDSANLFLHIQDAGERDTGGKNENEINKTGESLDFI